MGDSSQDALDGAARIVQASRLDLSTWAPADILSLVGVVGLIGLAFYAIMRTTNRDVLEQVIAFFRWYAEFYRHRAEAEHARTQREQAAARVERARAEAIEGGGRVVSMRRDGGGDGEE